MMPSKVEKLKQSLNGYAMGRNRVQLNDPGSCSFPGLFRGSGEGKLHFPTTSSNTHSYSFRLRSKEKKLKYHSVKELAIVFSPLVLLFRATSIWRSRGWWRARHAVISPSSSWLSVDWNDYHVYGTCQQMLFDDAERMTFFVLLSMPFLSWSPAPLHWLPVHGMRRKNLCCGSYRLNGTAGAAILLMTGTQVAAGHQKERENQAKDIWSSNSQYFRKNDPEAGWNHLHRQKVQRNRNHSPAHVRFRKRGIAVGLDVLQQLRWSTRTLPSCRNHDHQTWHESRGAPHLCPQSVVHHKLFWNDTDEKEQ